MHLRTLTKVVSAIACMVGLMVGGLFVAPAARADTQFQIAWTKIGIYPRSAPSMGSSQVGAALSDGTDIGVGCELEGETVSNGFTSSNIWEVLSDGTYIPNVYVNTGVDGWTPGVMRCDYTAPNTDAITSAGYDRDAAANWAIDNWDSKPTFDEDCTYFVSQAFLVGGIHETDYWHLDDLYPPTAASVANTFVNYMTENNIVIKSELSWSQNDVPNAERGDVIAYDWDSDGTIDHLSIITSFSGQYPYVTEHTNANMTRGWTWSIEGNDWLEKLSTEKYGQPAKVYLLHVN